MVSIKKMSMFLIFQTGSGFLCVFLLIFGQCSSLTEMMLNLALAKLLCWFGIFVGLVNNTKDIRSP